MATAEPRPEMLSSPLPRYLLATRPAFLTASALAVLVGLAAAGLRGPIAPVPALLTLLGAVLAHAGANALNDYYDALAGTDGRNTDRLFPYTGGSRFIQNGVMSPVAMARYGWILLAAAAVLGVLLLPRAGAGLLAVGAAGLLVGWAYSARGLRLSGRGLGEPMVLLGFGVLIPLGAGWVQRGGFVPETLLTGIPYGLLALNLLFINQFPDHRADAATGKRHWVVRLGPRRARWLYGGFALLAYAALAAAVVRGVLPRAALVALLPALLSMRAWRDLLRWAETPVLLEPAVRRTINALLAFGVLLAAGLWWAGRAVG
ncbi:prenyltransferase [Thiohalorhabdus denitrificans]|uniref:prenyltransferase n=1 Tax=Thiohalorhabdus denitrificans TaxID=381306 RepID=UPI001E4FF8C7|nr:prenyltransferase [Thiohalorhabdus denitrificans]